MIKQIDFFNPKTWETPYPNLWRIKTATGTYEIFRGEAVYPEDDGRRSGYYYNLYFAGPNLNGEKLTFDQVSFKNCCGWHSLFEAFKAAHAHYNKSEETKVTSLSWGK